MLLRGSKSLVGLFLMVTAGIAAAAEDDLGRELPRIEPLEPAAALKSFVIQSGFHLVPIAVEPSVTDPVSVCFDADGRLYVVEMRGYPYPEKTPTGYVTRLEDRDGDGTYEKRSIFLDGLSWPTGVVPFDGGVFITVAPDILYAKDTDGDGVADVRRVMFTGFGTDNVQGLLNGLLWGPDGWIYGVASSDGGEVRNLSRPDSRPVSVRGRDFRFKPDGSAFEAVSGGGQFGHAVDDWGHRFTCNNSNHIRQIVLPAREMERNPALVPPGAVLDIAAEGPAAVVYRISPAEPWRLVRTRQRAADPEMRKKLPPTELVPIGFFTSATGITVYRGTAYPSAYRGNAFIGDVGGNLVHRKILELSGSTYVATRADPKVEFLASSDNWFRPVNFANTPNGTLLILDMYRETIEHPWSIPEPIKKHLDLTSGKDRGRLYELVHEGKRPIRRPRLTGARTSELVALLADPDGWWRDTAQRLLIERRDPAAIAGLRQLVAGRPTPLGRLHGLWTLDVLAGLEPEDVLLGLSDPEPRVREQSIKLAQSRLKDRGDLLDAVVRLADDKDSLVRFQVALALGDAAPAAASHVVNALVKIALKDSGDRYTRAAVLSSVGSQQSTLLEELARQPGFLQTSEGSAWLADLATLIGARRNPEEIRGLIGRLLGSDVDPDRRARVVLAVGRGLRRAGGSLKDTVGLETFTPFRQLFREQAEVATRDDGDMERRIVAIELLGMGDPQLGLKVLPDLLDARQPAPVQLAVLQALGALPGTGVGKPVLDRWKSMAPSVRSEAAEVLFARADRLEDLLDALASKKLSTSEIDPLRLKQLRTLNAPRLREKAIRTLGRDSGTARDRDKTIVAYRPSLGLTGRREKGKDVFSRTCSTCHRVEGVGTEVGPDLVTVTGRAPEDLLLHILDPNREIAPNYLNYNVATSDGRVYSGIIANETASSLTLKRAEGASDVIPRSQIEGISSSGMSLMPEGLEKGLTPGDFADLIAFLRSIRTLPVNPPAGPQSQAR